MEYAEGLRNGVDILMRASVNIIVALISDVFDFNEARIAAQTVPYRFSYLEALFPLLICS